MGITPRNRGRLRGRRRHVTVEIVATLTVVIVVTSTVVNGGMACVVGPWSAEFAARVEAPHGRPRSIYIFVSLGDGRRAVSRCGGRRLRRSPARSTTRAEQAQCPA